MFTMYVHYTIPYQFPLAEADDQQLLPIDPDLYLGLEDDLIDCDEDLVPADVEIDVLAVPEVPMASECIYIITHYRYSIYLPSQCNLDWCSFTTAGSH
jgi:hypothetical protein